MRKSIAIAVIVASATLISANPIRAKELQENSASASEIRSDPLRNTFYGDLHLHTTLSRDAYILLGTKVTPDQAYRFAKGEAVSYLGTMVRRKRPLDFMAVTDHSEFMGVLNTLDDPNSALSKTQFGQNIRRARGRALIDYMLQMSRANASIPGYDPKMDTQSTWQKVIAAANSNYQPGRFTTFIAYEWSCHPDGKNLHRNVIFRGDNAPHPFSSTDSEKPEELWNYLERNREQGVEALAIPHNANASGGLMYDWIDSDGKPIDQAYAQRRILNEPLSEIAQAKGQSETHPLLSPDDEFASFELFDHLLVGDGGKIPSAPPGSYIRDAYGRGLVIQGNVGANPYKFGVVGATDFHNGLTTSDEDSFNSALNGGIDPTKDLRPAKTMQEYADVEILDTGSGALTGVWAEQNTRESIYDALRRKETFATSGPRLKFRFFGGWDFKPAILESRDWVRTAYKQGVPMGGDLPAIPANAKAPRFVIWALKDPDSGNLDRVQVIKIWLKNGKHEEKVFDVAYAGQRKPDPKGGKLPGVGNTVDLETATYINSIGATELSAVWEDPEFDAKLPAVYYLRVIEIPTPRWSTILAVKDGRPLPKHAPATIQERGWSSPIWYTPAKHPM